MLGDPPGSIWGHLPRGYPRKPKGALRGTPEEDAPLRGSSRSPPRSSLRDHLKPLERVLQEATE
eukprot:971393-Pyramimonas_sp.AAC.1